MTDVASVLQEHAEYLADVRRMSAYRVALCEAVRPGAIVVDLGAGTGALGLLALRAGATRVHAVEATTFIEATRAIARANGAADTVVHHHGSSLDVRLPERADLVVADQLGPFLHAGDLVRAFADATRRLLRPGATTVPRAVEPVLGLVERPELTARIVRWLATPAGFDVSSLRVKAANTPQSGRLAAADLLGGAVSLRPIEDWVEAATGWSGSVDVQIERDGAASAVAAWWVARLSASVRMSNAPGDPDAIDRDQALFPLDPPLPVRAGETVRAHVDLRFDSGLVSWSAEGPAGRRRGSTWASFPIDADDLSRTGPERRPALHEKGRARAWVLQACDGATSVEDLVVGVVAAFPSLFADRGAAEELVAGVVLANAE